MNVPSVQWSALFHKESMGLVLDTIRLFVYLYGELYVKTWSATGLLSVWLMIPGATGNRKGKNWRASFADLLEKYFVK
jgi:hypothetical protein